MYRDCLVNREYLVRRGRREEGHGGYPERRARRSGPCPDLGDCLVLCLYPHLYPYLSPGLCRRRLSGASTDAVVEIVGVGDDDVAVVAAVAAAEMGAHAAGDVAVVGFAGAVAADAVAGGAGDVVRVCCPC